MSRCLKIVAVLVVLFAMSGCGDDKITPPIIQPRIYPILSNPYNVMDALKTAYERRDTVEIKVLYDDAYQGTSIDQTDPSPTLLTFTKADEVAHVAKLANTSIVHLALLPSFSVIRFDDAGDPAGWTTLNNPFLSLDISDTTAARAVDFQAETSQFKFVPHAPDASSTTDTTWKIVRWTEVKN
ncbi:MAG TPA: hypothetical protein VFD83_01165 [Candidatus Polarisedimenticolia bacterium]|nr:hypothetical protein [Candidatus Polarisedimenticolia bacterium]